MSLKIQSSHQTSHSTTMKTVIVLCSFATIATALPALLQGNIHELDSVLENLPTNTRREKKSPLHDHALDSTADHGAEDAHINGSPKSVHELSVLEGRSLGFKKPIIVKKKYGYHLYRDSDEEMAYADPHEKCRKQVKVKLCDDHHGPHAHMANLPEKEMENSIKMAKEAVENLQRGLKKMEHNSAKVSHKEEDIKSDAELHEDIEVARQALEHIQHNFGNLESLNLEMNAPKIADLHLSKFAEEERLAQWKEAIDNIQKNFEIARNIEDTFKSETHQTSMFPSESIDTTKMRNFEHSDFNSHQKSESTSMDDLKSVDDSLKLRKSSDEEHHSVEHHSEQGNKNMVEKHRNDAESDMFTSPTEHKESKMELHSDSLRTEISTADENLLRMNTADGDHSATLNNEKQTMKEEEENENHLPKMKSSELISMADSKKAEDMVVKHEQERTSKLIETGEKITKQHNEDNKRESTMDTDKNEHMKMEKVASLEGENDKFLSNKKSKDDNIEQESHHAKSAQLDSVMSTEESKNLEHKHDVAMKSTEGIAQSHSMNMHGKSSLHDESLWQKAKSTHDKADEALSARRAQNIEENETHNNNEHHEIFNMRASNSENLMPTEAKETHNKDHFRGALESHILQEQLMNFQKSASLMPEVSKEHSELNDVFNMRFAEEKHQGHMSETPTKSIGFNNVQHNVPQEHLNMRESQDQVMWHQLAENNNKQNPLLMRWAQEKQQRGHLSQQFNVMPEFHNEHLKQHLNEHLHDGGHLNSFNGQFNLDNSHDISSVGSSMHNHMNIMKHGKSSDMDSSMQPSMHMNMREILGKSASEGMQWNHHHSMARSGYGSGLPLTGASPGAVGVFPNANVGGCGIPLLLSCSPSVVSGSLAKTHPTSITAPAYRSGDDLMFYMKRDAKHTDENPIKIQKLSTPFNLKTEKIIDKAQ